MFHNNAVIRQVLQVLLWEVILVGLMLGVYALIGRFSAKVLLGAVIGGVLSVLNFVLLSITVSRAANRAEDTGEAAKATLSVQVSSVVRMILLLVVYIVILKLKLCDPVASLLPLVFVQLSIMLMEFFRKVGEKHK